MLKPEDALETLDNADRYLELLSLGRDRTAPMMVNVLDTRQRVQSMRDELWAVMVKNDPVIGDALWWQMNLPIPYSVPTADREPAWRARLNGR